MGDHTLSDRSAPGGPWLSNYCTSTCDCGECYADGTGIYSGNGPAREEFRAPE